ncbi:MAG TPA: hypothetical protein VH309_02135, partial [Elusimicrobiota bacterium]|nr:hypothetical protein [Elusimicrobiota bacterium]
AAGEAGESREGREKRSGLGKGTGAHKEAMVHDDELTVLKKKRPGRKRRPDLFTHSLTHSSE